MRNRRKLPLLVRRKSRLLRGSSIGSRPSRISTSNAGYLGLGTIASMGRSPESAPLHLMHHSIARSAVRDRRYRKRRWRAAVVAAILAVASTANSADAPPLLSPEQMNASEIQLALQKLNVLGRVLYIAAHPDDENTNLMAFWANGSLYDAAYLSVTRGDGGQNLIGRNWASGSALFEQRNCSMRGASITPGNSLHGRSISGFRRRLTKQCTSGITTKFSLTSCGSSGISDRM